jgi:transposase
MDFIPSASRNQLEFSCLEDFIEKDNAVRFIDAFVDKLDLKQLYFVANEVQCEGRPSFNPKVFLKIYFYGYLNGIRSSRKLERECKRNIELQWLICKLVPNYHSIADFRKVNGQALRNTFKLYVSFLKEAELIGGNIVAIDGTKMRANNSKKNNFSAKKIQRHLDYIEEKTNQYLNELDANDEGESPIKLDGIAKKIERLKTNKIKYELLSKELEQSGEPQISTTDKDARALLVQGQVVEVCHNLEAAVDNKHSLVVATHTINRNDRNALSAIAIEAKDNLEVEELTSLSDKGFHNGKEIQTCNEHGIATICAHAEIVNSNSKGTTPEYLVTYFTYNKQDDTYTCPQGETLQTTGTWHTKVNGTTKHQFKKYRTPACKACPVKHLCTGRAQGGREIDRSEYAEAVEENNKRYQENPQLYRTRQEINEHIFGTIKRQWGYNHTNLRGLKKVNGEFALIMTVYNMKRSMNILGMETILEKIKNWKPNYKGMTLLYQKVNLFNAISAHQNIEMKLAA